MSREAELLEQLQSQKDALVIEKQKVEGDLQKAMERAIEEKNKELEEQLHKEKERLEKVYILMSFIAQCNRQEILVHVKTCNFFI